MRNDVGVAIILLTGAVAFGGVIALSLPSSDGRSAAPLTYEVREPAYNIIPPIDLPVVQAAAVVAEPEAPAGPPPAFSTRTPVAALMSNPDARAVVLQDIPALSVVSGEQIASVGDMSLRMVQGMLPAILTDAALKKLDQDLAKIPAPSATPAATVAAEVAPADPSTDPPAQTQVAAFSSRSTLSSLLGNPGARAVLMREIPALAQTPQAQLNLAANLTLRDIQRLMPDAVTDAALQRVDQGLAALTAPAVPAAAATGPEA